MTPQQRVFELYDMKTGKHVFTGIAPECAKFCGGKSSNFLNSFHTSRSCSYHGYKIVLVQEASETTTFTGSDAAAIKRWDAMMTPLREKYNIPRYRSREVRR